MGLDTEFLDASELTFFRAPEGDVRLRLQIASRCCFMDVRASKLLPVSDPGHYWALRNANDVEIGVLLDPTLLDSASLQLLEHEVNRRYFLPKVVSVQSVRDQHGVVVWDVTTDAGERRYTVKNLRDNSVALSSRRVLMTDIDGNRFEFPNIEKLGTAAQDVLLKVL